MNNDDRFIAQLEDYLDAFDGTTPLPDRVRDAIRAELPSARQVQPRPGPLRIFTMLSNASAGARVGLGAAAIVAVLVLGAAVLNNRGNSPAVGAAATTAPTATISPTTATTTTPTSAATAAPSVAAVPPTLDTGTHVACDPADTAKSCVAPGTYQMAGGAGVWPVMVTIDVPAGWFEPNYQGLGVPGTGWDAVLVQGGPAIQYAGTGWGVMFTTVSDVNRDPCDASRGTIPAAQVNTPQKLAAAIAAWPKFTATPPQPITVDGHSGLELKLTRPVKTPACGGGVSWLSASGTPVDAYPMVNDYGRSYPTIVRIVDTGKGLLVIRATDFPQTTPAELGAGVVYSATRHAKDQIALHAILNSIKLTP